MERLVGSQSENGGLATPIERMLIQYYDHIDRSSPSYEAEKEKIADSILRYYEQTFPGELPMHPDAHAAVSDALDVVFKLRDAIKERTCAPEIEAIIVFSGGGTYEQKLLPGQSEWFRWGDRDRVRAGIAVAHEVVKSRIKEKGIALSHELSNAEYELYGPTLIYPGNPQENTGLQSALESGIIHYPSSKIKIVDTVYDSVTKTRIPIRHTGDQIEIVSKDLNEFKNIAVVQHIPDYVRLPFYLNKIDRTDHPSRRYWAFALQSRRGSSQELREDTLGEHLMNEFPRLIRYLKKGDLSPRPVKFENLP